MKKVMTAREIAMLQETEGATVSRLPSAVESLMEGLRADLKAERTQRAAEVEELRSLFIQTVEKIAMTMAESQIDLDRLASIFGAAAQSPMRPDYRFDVERDSNGQITNINATKVTH